MNTPQWWNRPRKISVVVDNDSWILPYAKTLVGDISATGDQPALCRTHDEITEGAVAFYLGCLNITPPRVLARNRRNLVVHASDLPQGKGFSPLTWMILEGRNEIPICLIDAAETVDSGAIVYRDTLSFGGHELIDEMREVLGLKHIDLCRRFLAAPTAIEGVAQTGESSFYPRRTPEDNRLDPSLPISDQFELLRVVDNEKYPAFFDICGHRYELAVRKVGPLNVEDDDIE